MDGFGRSANTYAWAAFLYANGLRVPIATHRHSPALIEEGVRRGIPTIVLIRRSRGALASALQYSPEVRPLSAIRCYRRYYERVLPLLNSVLVATFDEVIGDFGGVTRRCNQRFGASFQPYERTPEAEAAVMRMIDDAAARVAAPDRVSSMVPRPSPDRRPASEVLQPIERMHGVELDQLDALYDEILSLRNGVNGQ